MPPDTPVRPPEDSRSRWLDRKGSADKICWSVAAACVLLFLADAFYEKHPAFDVEYVFGFYGLFGFVACLGLVLVAKGLRRILKRDEGFYDGPDGNDRGAA